MQNENMRLFYQNENIGHKYWGYFFFVLIIFVLLIGCKVNVKSYELSPLQYPEWIHTEIPGFAGPEKRADKEYNNANLFVWDGQVNGNNFSTLKAIIDPKKLPIDYLYIKELSFIKDNEKIFLIENKKIKYTYNFLPVVNLKFRDYQKYFKNMELNESVKVILTIIYQFDDGPLLVDEIPYEIHCFEYEHHPNIVLWIFNQWKYSAWAIYYLWILSIIIMIIIFIKNIVSKIFCNNVVKCIPVISILLSIISFISFSFVFIFNRGSNVAQLSESFNLWAFWFHTYTFLFYSNLFIIILFILSMIFKRKIFNSKNIMYYISLALNIILNVFHILPNFPDA
jgi:hypothetical protein